MSDVRSFWSRFMPFKRLPAVDRYHVMVVTNAAELTLGEELPIELRYVLAVRPARMEAFRQLLDEGFGIGVRTVEKTPERVLASVDRISRGSQHNTILPWLELLLRDGELPVCSEAERADAKLILAERFAFKKIVLVALENQCVTEREQRMMDEINADLYPHAVEAILNRVTFDNAHTRTEVAQTIVKALIIVGPIAHVLEHALTGIGKVFAATSDDLLSEAAELFALRGSGFTWKQLVQRSRVLVPIFILSVYGAFQVEPLIRAGHPALAGAVFGLSAVALSLTTALQSVRLYHQSYAKLFREGKLRHRAGRSAWSYAIVQDFTNPARLGLFIGALCSPLAAAIVFAFLPGFTTNGWVLAMLGSTESLVAGLTVFSAARINRWRFREHVRRAILLARDA